MGANTTTYKRAGAYVTDPVLNETTGQFSANYTPGVSERRAGVSTFLHSGLKNADSRTTDGSAVSADRQYDAFGNLTGGNGTWNGPFGYAGGYGYQEDGESGLKLLGHRYYDSTTGRFLSKDVARDGRNWYAYCDNSPVRRVDANGLDWVVIQMDEGGRGHGSHARIGLWDGNPKHEIQWYGLYSEDGGTFQMHDNPKMGPSRTVCREISPRQRLDIQRELMLRRMEYLQGKGKKYNLSGHNCTHFITNVLIHAGILGEDYRDSSRSPDELVRHLQNDYWSDTPWATGSLPKEIGKGGVWPWYSPTAPPRKGSSGKGGGSRRSGS